MRSRRFGVNRRRLMVLAAPAVLAIPSFLHAQTFTAFPTGDYTQGVNWSTNPTAPTASTNPLISNGGTATIGDGENGLGKNLSIGIGGTGTGTLTLSSNATYTGAGVVAVGTTGTSTGGVGMLINAGTFSTTGNILVGNGTFSTGTLIMSGGSLSTTGTLFALGASASGAGNLSPATGTLIQNGGAITISTGTFGVGRIGTGYYDMEGGTLTDGGTMQIATSGTGIGTIVQNNGTINGVVVTLAANGTASYAMGGGTLLISQGLNLSNNAACVATFTNNGGYISTGSVVIGVGGATTAAANFSMSAGTLAVGTNMLVGGSPTTTAAGTFTETGGFLSVGSAFFVGSGTNSSGVMNISGTGSIQGGAASTVYVGTSGSGTFNLCSLAAGTSSLSAGTIQVGSLSALATGEVDSQFLMGSTTLAGALPTVTVGTIDFTQTDANAATTRLFSIASGTLTAGLVDLTSYDAGGTALNHATFQQLGGTVTMTSMTFAGGIYQVGNATVAPVVVNGAALTVNPGGPGILPLGNTATFAGGGTIATTGSVTLNGALANNGAVLNVGAATNGTGTVSFRGAQTNAVGSGITVNSGQVNMQTDGGMNLTFTVGNVGKATLGGGTFINQTENLGTLSILGGGVARMFSNGPAATPTILLHAGTLSIHADVNSVPTGTLDMAADDAIVDNGVFATMQAQVKSGYAGGTWNGPGIKSSTAAGQAAGLAGIGYATLAELGNPTTFDGQTLAVLAPNATSSSVALKYTLLGDANMDGTVNALDFNALATNFGTGGKDWTQGDFNYSSDGTVDSNDFALLATNYNKTVASLSSAAVPDAMPEAALGSVVPEPASIGLLLACGVGVMTRRRRV